MNINLKKNALVIFLIIIAIITFLYFLYPKKNNLDKKSFTANVLSALSDTATSLDTNNTGDVVITGDNLVIDGNVLPEEEWPVFLEKIENTQIENEDQKFTTEEEFFSQQENNFESPNQCIKQVSSEKLYVLLGEKIDKNLPYKKTPLSDIWSSFDGINWKLEATNTKMGAKWMPALLKINNTVYIFGGVYNSENKFDTSIYKTKDMVIFDYVGELPSDQTGILKRNIVVHFKNKFWLLSGSGIKGVWSSYDGSNWVQESKSAPWEANDAYMYLQSAITSDENILFIGTNNKGAPHIPLNYISSDGVNWTEYDPIKYFYINGWSNLYSPLKFGNQWISIPRHMSDELGNPLTYEYFYHILSMPIKNIFNPGKDSWSVKTGLSSAFNREKVHSEELGEVLISFKNKLWTIGGAKDGTQSGKTWLKNDNKPGTLGTIMNSTNGYVWRNVTQNGVTYPGPADRTNAVATTLPWTYISENAPDLEISSLSGTNYIATNTQDDVLLGEWNLSAKSFDSRTTFTGRIRIDYIDLLGTFIPPNTSSFDKMANIEVYVNDKLVSNITNFEPPFYTDPCLPYSSCGYVVPQRIKFMNGLASIVLSQGQSVNLKIKADIFDAPNEFTTSIYGFGFNKYKNGNPCQSYDAVTKRNMYKYDGKTIKINPYVLPVLPKTQIPS